MKLLSLTILTWSLTASIGALAFENGDDLSPNGNGADVIEIMKAPKKWVCFTIPRDSSTVDSQTPLRKHEANPAKTVRNTRTPNVIYLQIATSW
jgi:hypothetical protein